MTEENYNGMYEMRICIIVTASSHDTCRWITSRFKNLIKAFDFGNFQSGEAKSARKGDVLTRTIKICLTDYSSNILIFRECIDRLIESCNIWYGEFASVRTSLIHTSRKDAHINLIKETL